MKEVKCDNCCRKLFNTNRTSLGAEATNKGFVAKMPMFYGVGEFKIFCDKECCKSWFQSNISKEDRNSGDKAVKKVFNDKTKQELKQGIASGLQAIQGLFKELKGMTKEERQDYLLRLKVELENRRKNEFKKNIQTQETTTDPRRNKGC